MIPPLVVVDGAEHPVLPPGIHRCTVEELQKAFVDSFPASATRRADYSGFRKLRENALRIGLRGFQRIDGSFVEGKPDPNDIDVVTVCTHESATRLGAAGQEFLDATLARGKHAKAVFQTDSFLLLELPEGHPQRDLFLQSFAGWREFWGRTRTGIAKGFLQLELEPEGEP